MDVDRSPAVVSSKAKKKLWLVSFLGRYWLVMLLSLYFILSVTYQVTPVVREKTFGVSRADYLVNGEYRLALNFPNTILLEVAGNRGRPLTAWLWTENGTISPATETDFQVLFFVGYSPDNPNLVVFTDADGLERDSQLTLKLAPLEPEAQRATVYLARRVSDLLKNSGELRVEVWRENQKLHTERLTKGADAITLRLETRGEALGRRIGDLLLNTPALTWVTVAGAIFTAWLRINQEHELRVKNLRDQIGELEKTPADILWLTYWDLRIEIEKSGSKELVELLQQTWDKIKRQDPTDVWQIYLKVWLTEQISSARKNKTAQKAIEKTLGKLCEAGVIGKEERDPLLSLINLDTILESAQNYQGNLETTLRAFRNLGLASTEMILSKLPQSVGQEHIDLLKSAWYTNGGAAGKFLLQQKAANGTLLQKRLDQWIREEDPSTAIAALWRVPFSGVSAVHVKALNDVDGNLKALDTPFGPEKAERDCRLAPAPPISAGQSNLACQGRGLFWDAHPMKERVWESADGMFIAPPGSGRTTLIWMARYEYRFMGTSPGLSLYLPVKLPSPNLHQLCSKALADNLLDTLVEDPFWLLAAECLERPVDSLAQREIVGFLLQEFGSHAELAQQLSLRRFALDKADSRDSEDSKLLFQLIHRFSPIERKFWNDLPNLTKIICGALARARGKDIAEFPVYIWIDIHHAMNPEDVTTLVTAIKDDEILHQVGFVKVFLPEAPQVTATRLQWTPQQITELLKHRSLIAEEKLTMKLNPLLDNQDVFETLARNACGSPQRAIHAGNLLLEKYGRQLA